MDSHHWLFDVDGTLIDSITGTSLRPWATQLLSRIRSANGSVFLWSAGGAEYAWRKAQTLGFAHLVDATFDKKRERTTVPWEVPRAIVDIGPLVLVDDEPRDVPDIGRKVPVRQYLGPNPHDEALKALHDAITFD